MCVSPEVAESARNARVELLLQKRSTSTRFEFEENRSSPKMTTMFDNRCDVEFEETRLPKSRKLLKIAATGIHSSAQSNS